MRPGQQHTLNCSQLLKTCRAVLGCLRQMLFTRVFSMQYFKTKLSVMYGYVFSCLCCSHFLQVATQPADALPYQPLPHICCQKRHTCTSCPMQALTSSLPQVFPGNNREKIKHQWLLIPELDNVAQIITIQFIRPAQNAPGNLAHVCACSWITLARHRPVGHFRSVDKTSHAFLTCHVDTKTSN